MKCIHRGDAHRAAASPAQRSPRKCFPVKMVQGANYEAELVSACRKDLDFHNTETERKTEENEQARGKIERAAWRPRW